MYDAATQHARKKATPTRRDAGATARAEIPSRASVCSCGGGCPRCMNTPRQRRRIEPAGAPEYEPTVAATAALRPPTQVTQGVNDMPAQLQAGVEALSGFDLSSVRVHRNSAEPARLHAHAFTRGREIFIAPKQERHLPHEAWHAVQQMQGRVRSTLQVNGEPINDQAQLEREADVMGARALQQRSSESMPAAVHPPPTQAPVAQREMKFELQTYNRIWRNDGVNPPRRLERKYGPEDFLVKGAHGVRLESETDGVLEFETEWFRKWSDLEQALQEAAAMTQTMNQAEDLPGGRKAFPFDVVHLRTGSRRELRKGAWDWKKGYEGAGEKILGEDERLEVEIVNDTWNAAIQSSESIALTQFESLLKEHEPSHVASTGSAGDSVVADIAAAAGKPPAEFAKLRSFLQLIFYYIERGRTDLKKPDGDLEPSKFAFLLMSRTSFSSMYQSLLSADEQAAFRNIVREQTILKKIHLTAGDYFFKDGHGGGRGPTIHNWLQSIADPRTHGRRVEDKKGKTVHRDLLSPPRGGSAAMGAFDVETEPGKKNTKLVRFETRNTARDFKTVEKQRGFSSIRVQPAAQWVAYARELFQYAATERKRPSVKDDPTTPADETEKTTLIYDAPPPAAAGADLKLNLKFAAEQNPELELEFRKSLPRLLDGKLEPFVYAGVGTRGLGAGAGATVEPFSAMSLFLTGKAGVRTEWFTSLEVGGALEAGWAIDKNRSLRLGIGWETWQRLDEDAQRTHLLNVFVGKRF